MSNRYQQADRVIELSPAALARLDSLVSTQPIGCWPWLGRLDRYGYGVFKPCKGTLSLAHRVVYQLFAGHLLSSDEQIDHLCRNRSCCNPTHFDIVDNRTNKIRGEIALGRRRSTGGTCKYGHALIGSNIAPYSGRIACRICRRDAHRRWLARSRGVEGVPISGPVDNCGTPRPGSSL